jgi:hypothetical protein
VRSEIEDDNEDEHESDRRELNSVEFFFVGSSVIVLVLVVVLVLEFCSSLVLTALARKRKHGGSPQSRRFLIRIENDNDDENDNDLGRQNDHLAPGSAGCRGRGCGLERSAFLGLGAFGNRGR